MRTMRNGFSLVELLVVISILTLMAALLLPTMDSALEQARRMMCCGNLRQILVGANNYSNENGHHIPYFPYSDSTYGTDSCQYALNFGTAPNRANTGWTQFLIMNYMDAALMGCPSMDVKPVFSHFTTGLHYSFKYNSFRSINQGFAGSGVSTAQQLAMLKSFKINSTDPNDVVFHEAVPYRNSVAPVVTTTLNWQVRKWSHIDGGYVIQCDGRITWVPTNISRSWPFTYYIYRPQYLPTIVKAAQ